MHHPELGIWSWERQMLRLALVEQSTMNESTSKRSKCEHSGMFLLSVI